MNSISDLVRNPIMILIGMLFLHIIEDFHLQGILANLKCKSWWEENYPQKKYKNDYKVALLVHSFEWAIFILIIPFIIIPPKNTISNLIYLGLLISNTWLHYKIDDNKANKYKLNLIHDQCLHLIQILITWSSLELIWYLMI